MKKKWMRVLSCILAVMLLAGMLTGCGRKKLDAEKAVDAYLRAVTKGEFEDYAKLVDEDKKELEEQYDEMIDQSLESLEELEVLGADFDDNLTKEIKNLLASAKYEVTGHKEKDDGYVVDVEVYPSDAFSLFFGKVIDAAKSVEDTDELGDMFVQALQDAIVEQSYGEAVKHQVHIGYDEDEKKYEIDEDDIEELTNDFFEIGNLMEQLITPSGTDYGNPYLNWTKDEWDAASDEEQTKCCLVIVQHMNGLTDEQMSTIDLNDAAIQENIQLMKDGLNAVFQSGANISIGDYVEFLAGQM